MDASAPPGSPPVPRGADPWGTPPTPLTGRDPLALQFDARGYSLSQLGTLVFMSTPGDVSALLQRAAEVLGLHTVPAAVAEAKRRGLVV